MSDVIVRVPMAERDAAAVFDVALSMFASWREAAEAALLADDDDAPPLMIHTETGQNGLIKVLVFQARSEAAAFLGFLRQARRPDLEPTEATISSAA